MKNIFVNKSIERIIMEKRKLILYSILLVFYLVILYTSDNNKMLSHFVLSLPIIMLFLCIIWLSNRWQILILSFLSTVLLFITGIRNIEWNNIPSLNYITVFIITIIFCSLFYEIIILKDRKYKMDTRNNINVNIRNIYDKYNGFVFVIDNDILIVNLNKYAEFTLKYNKNELRNTCFLKLFSEKVHNEISEMISKDKIISRKPLFIFKKTGRTIPIEIHSIIRDSINKNTCIIFANIFNSNINEHQRVSNENNIFIKIFNLSIIMQVIISRDNYKIIKTNRSFAEHLRIHSETMIGTHFNKLFDNSYKITENIDCNNSFKIHNIKCVQNNKEYTITGRPIFSGIDYFMIFIEENNINEIQLKEQNKFAREDNYAYKLFIKTIDSISDQVYIIDSNYTIKLVNRSANQFCDVNGFNNNIGQNIFENLGFIKKDESELGSILLSGSSLKSVVTIVVNGREISLKIKYCTIYNDSNISNIMIVISEIIKENNDSQSLLFAKYNRKKYHENLLFTICMQDKKGEKRWIQNKKLQISDSEGNIWQITDIANNLTNDKQTQYELLKFNETQEMQLTKRKEESQKEIKKSNQLEESLRESQKLFRCYFELGPLGMAITSPNTNWLQVNKTLRVMLGYSEQELLNMTWTEITHPDDYNDEMTQYLNIMKGEISGYQQKKRFIHKDGQIVYTMLSVKGMYHSNKTIKNVLMLMQDMTEINRTREKLAAKLEFEKGLANCSRILLREDIPPEQAISETLKVLLKTIEISRIFIHENYEDKKEKLCNRLVYEVCAPEVKSEMQNPQQIHLSYDSGFNRWKFLMLQKQIINSLVENLPQSEQQYFRSRKIKSILVIPLFLTNNWIGFIGFENVLLNKDWNNNEIEMLHTVTDMIVAYIGRKKTEIELENEKALLTKRVAERTKALSSANAQLAQAAKLKDEFIASMSHELRTPLNAILGLSEALVDQVYGPLNADHIRTLNTVGESGRHLLELINDILDLSKIGAGNCKLEINDVNISSVCELSLRFVNQQCINKHIEIETKYDENVKRLKVDERRLKQILVNLLSNAIKFSPIKGKIILSIKGDAEKQVVKFIVSDSGIGIAEEEMDKLFKPFVQLDSSLSRKHGGTGLGLSLVQKLVEMHGGSISVESQVAKGSTFIVSLPWQEFHESSETNLPSENDEKALSNIGRIIVYTNNNSSYDKLNKYFKEWHFKDVEYVSEEKRFLSVITSNPNLLILDLGYCESELCMWLNEIKTDLEVRDLTIIILTDQPIDTSKIVLKNAKTINIQKPINKKLLIRTIRELTQFENDFHESNALSGVKKMHTNQQSVIMLAEDNEYNINMIYDYLTAKNYLVIVARNGKEAVNLLHESIPDLILMDIQMPEMDGIEAMEVIRQNESFHEIPIIALTALAMPGDRERCLMAGANDYLTKPVSLKILINTIENFISKKENIHEM